MGGLHMNTILEEIKPETADRLEAQAKTLGISVDALLNRILAGLAQVQTPYLSLAEVDHVLNELAMDGDQLPPLPEGFSRDDIYSDHD